MQPVVIFHSSSIYFLEQMKLKVKPSDRNKDGRHVLSQFEDEARARLCFSGQVVASLRPLLCPKALLRPHNIKVIRDMDAGAQFSVWSMSCLIMLRQGLWLLLSSRGRATRFHFRIWEFFRRPSSYHLHVCAVKLSFELWPPLDSPTFAHGTQTLVSWSQNVSFRVTAVVLEWCSWLHYGSEPQNHWPDCCVWRTSSVCYWLQISDEDWRQCRSAAALFNGFNWFFIDKKWTWLEFMCIYVLIMCYEPQPEYWQLKQIF